MCSIKNGRIIEVSSSVIITISSLLQLFYNHSLVEWEFSISAYFVNIVYLSTINESYWDEPEILSGLVLWLLLVPAIACVVQLPGSVFLYRRSNFYRFTPEIGLADCLATVCLVSKAVWYDCRWKEAIAAVFLVRDGVGSGEL